MRTEPCLTGSTSHQDHQFPVQSQASAQEEERLQLLESSNRQGLRPFYDQSDGIYQLRSRFQQSEEVVDPLFTKEPGNSNIPASQRNTQSSKIKKNPARMEKMQKTYQEEHMEDVAPPEPDSATAGEDVRTPSGRVIRILRISCL